MSVNQTAHSKFTLKRNQLEGLSSRDALILYDIVHRIVPAEFEVEKTWEILNPLLAMIEDVIMALPADDLFTIAAKIRVSVHTEWVDDVGVARLLADAQHITRDPKHG